MFVPRIYRSPDPGWTREIIRGYPLALLVTNGAETPNATHAPIIFADGEDGAGDRESDLVGARLLGHINRANPQWKEIESGSREALLVFSGANSYVSPTIYGFEPAAPTWDFTTVHLRGPVTPVEDREASLEVVVATVCAFEARFGNDWSPESSLEYFRTILPGVGAFSVEIKKVEAMFKLSQEQKPDTRQRVMRDFAGSDESMRREIARLIAALNEPSSPESRA